jgi:hypothetical protein
MNYDTPDGEVYNYLQTIKSNANKSILPIQVSNNDFTYAIALVIAKKIVEEKKQDLFKPLSDLGHEYFLYRQNDCSSRLCCEFWSCCYCCNCCGLCKLTVSSKFAKSAELYAFDYDTNEIEHWKSLKMWNKYNILEMLECRLQDKLSMKHVGHEKVTDQFGLLVINTLAFDYKYDILKSMVYNILKYKLKVLDGPMRVVMNN